LFWLASAISVIGYQLAFISLPWLVLNLTGTPLPKPRSWKVRQALALTLPGCCCPASGTWVTGSHDVCLPTHLATASFARYS
jgi:hypothetical protein